MNKRAVQEDSGVTRHSFVVRLWQEKGSAGWRGWVQHTRSGDAAFVQDLDELLAFVEHGAGLPPKPPAARLK